MSTDEKITGKPGISNGVRQRARIAQAFKTVALSPDMRHRWLTCETWSRSISTRTSTGVMIEVNPGTVSSSLSRDLELSTYADRYKPGDNMTGYFKVEYKKVKFYYVCNAGDSIQRPKLTPGWYAEVMKNQQIVAVTVAAVTVADEDADDIAVPNQRTTKRRKIQLDIEELRKQTYFDSPEAAKLLTFFKRKLSCRNWERLLEL
jgi:hypothetical protein